MRKKHYVGLVSGKGLTYFASLTEPTEENQPTFSAVVGPFKTKRAALWAERYGYQNPHFQHVDYAERMARRLNERT